MQHTVFVASSWYEHSRLKVAQCKHRLSSVCVSLPSRGEKPFPRASGTRLHRTAQNSAPHVMNERSTSTHFFFAYTCRKRAAHAVSL
jgi:hypothetical protein